MKAELRVVGGCIRVEIVRMIEDDFYSFELHDSGVIVGGTFGKITEKTIAAVRERLETLLHPEKMC